MQENSGVNEKRGKSGLMFKLVILLVLVVLGFVGWKYYDQQKNTTGASDQVANSQQVANDKETQAEIDKATKELIAKVGKLIILPDEQPTLATVLDAKKLMAEQPFYVGAENGDQLLVYQKAQKAILYNPTKNILVNVGPVYFNNEEDASATTTTTKK